MANYVDCVASFATREQAELAAKLAFFEVYVIEYCSIFYVRSHWKNSLTAIFKNYVLENSICAYYRDLDSYGENVFFCIKGEYSDVSKEFQVIFRDYLKFAVQN